MEGFSSHDGVCLNQLIVNGKCHKRRMYLFRTAHLLSIKASGAIYCRVWLFALVITWLSRSVACWLYSSKNKQPERWLIR